MRRPRIAGELMEFSLAANWMTILLPRMAQVVEPLLTMLEERMAGAPRWNAKVGIKRAFSDDS